MRGLVSIVLLVGGCLSAPSDSAGKPDAALENLLSNGTFDDGTAGWEAADADLYGDGEPRNGTGALAGCTDAEPPPTMHYITTSVTVDAGRYRGWVWARRRPEASGQLVKLELALEDSYTVSPTKVLGVEWQLFEADLESEGGGLLTLQVVTEPVEAGDCVLLDDAWLVRE